MIRAAELRYILIKYKHLINPNNLFKVNRVPKNKRYYEICSIHRCIELSSTYIG